MARPRPPVTMPARQVRRAAMNAIAPLGVVAVALTWWLGGAGRAGLMVVAVGAAMVAVGGARGRLSAAATMAGAVVLLGFAAGMPVFFAVLAVGVAGWIATRPIGIPDDLTAESVVPLGPDAVGPGAETLVAGFEAIGYRQVGALGFSTMGHRVVASILIGPDGDRHATVTDSIIAITSRFGHRTLVSRNSGMTRLRPVALDNSLRGATPDELDRSHSLALAALPPSIEPDGVDPVTVVEQAIDDERRSILWSRAQPKPVQSRSGMGPGPLADAPDRAARVSAWLLSPPD